MEFKYEKKSQEGRRFPRAGRAAPWDFPQSSPASPRKIPSFSLLLLGLTHSSRYLLNDLKCWY